MILLTYIYKCGKYFIRFFWKFSWIITFLKFKLNKVSFHSDFQSNGIPITAISLKSRITIGRQFVMNNGKYYNMIGRQQQCYFVVTRSAELFIGNNVGVSAVVIVCWNKIIIGNNVRIGGGTVIYDTDFHSLKAEDRLLNKEDISKVKTAPVEIKDNAFIGANCTLLKGISIGQNSIIGACSVVTKSVPDNEIWAGNPAQLIRKIQ